MARTYDHNAIEAKWRAWWDEHGTYRTLGPDDPGFDASRPKFYVLDMFPYPSGKGLHVGHPIGYIATDVLARFKRMRGFNVLHPMGFDAFGLPAEQFAIEHNIHPRITVQQNIETMRRQLRELGLGYDWQREIATIDPAYYRWTQWIFLQLYGSWFDPSANAARPIGDLIAALERGEFAVDETGGPVAALEREELAVDETGVPVAADSEGGRPTRVLRAWSELDEDERRAVIDGRRLAYLAEVPVNWCPGLGTVLANEEVTADGRSERGNFPVYRRPLEQWMLRITAYADRLIVDLDRLEWPEAVKSMQRNWIGRSDGARIRFKVEGAEQVIEVFTTRPDTLFGATYMVLAPEHTLVDVVTGETERAAVEAYRAQTSHRSDVDRQVELKEKTGVSTGGYAINPATGGRIPIWIADYVLMGYGTGAIMAVPAGDHRDFEFAIAFDLPIVPVVMPGDGWLREMAERAGRRVDLDDAGALRADYLLHADEYPEGFVGEGTGVNSANGQVSLDGWPTSVAKRRIVDWLEERVIGHTEVQYKLRDWLFSRQRYWGEPFPILHGPNGEIRPVDEDDLPVELPPMDDFKPRSDDDPDAKPRPPLSRAPESWRVVELDGVRYERELNTMPNWAGSCWYYLRYIDPENEGRIAAPEHEAYWMGDHGVDLYVGGVEHAVLHLLYARFWHKVLYDLGHVSTVEPFARLINQGYIQAPAFVDDRGVYVPADEVKERDGKHFFGAVEVAVEFGKMGKSLKNMVTPDAIVARSGCDTLRLYEMYMGPIDQSKPWNTRDIVGITRFLARVWRNVLDVESGEAIVSDAAPSAELERALHLTIRRVTEDYEQLRFNTALAALIELNNMLVALDSPPRAVIEPFVIMLAPLAPHMAEELWEILGHPPSITQQPWPEHDPAKLVADTLELVLQVNGKVRGHITVPANADRDSVEAAALADEGVRRHLDGAPVGKVIVVPGKLVNIVANQ